MLSHIPLNHNGMYWHHAKAIFGPDFFLNWTQWQWNKMQAFYSRKYISNCSLSNGGCFGRPRRKTLCVVQYVLMRRFILTLKFLTMAWCWSMHLLYWYLPSCKQILTSPASVLEIPLCLNRIRIKMFVVSGRPKSMLNGICTRNAEN